MIKQVLGHAHNVNKPLPCARPSPHFQKETPIPFGVTVTIPLNLEQRSSNKRNKWRGPAAGGEQAVYAGLMLERRVRFSSYRCSTAIKLSEEPNIKEASGQKVFSFQIAQRDQYLDRPVTSLWDPI